MNKPLIFSLLLAVLSLIQGCNPPQKTVIITDDETTPELILDVKAQLGEGAFWHPEQQKLFWVDIEGKLVHVYDPATGEDIGHPVGQRVGTVVPDDKNGAVVALENGIYYLNLLTDSLTFLAKPAEHLAGVRFNDGKCDPSGRLWVGSMHLEGKKDAALLYRMDPDYRTEAVFAPVTVSNGIVWSLDKKIMYYVDTPTLTVKAFDYDDATGAISNPRVVVQVSDTLGYPDGMTIDAEGKLWVAHWGGSAVIRWDPETGAMMERIRIPAPNTTSCAFGGDDLSTLYITSASVGLENPADYPLSGGVFAVKSGVKGVKSTLFASGKP